VTPNSDEARLLTKCDKLNEAAKILINKCARAVLITGTHEETEDVVNQLFLNDGSHTEYRWPRLPETYHGSGCTLASRIAACLALTNDLVNAVELAQDYTWHALKHSEQTGSGQWHPNRFFVS
jgi:hydroxymethylpyrimidine/phosphomethylpyrimidine kinase